MKKLVFALLVIFVFCLSPVIADAADWSQFESIRNNVRVEGYQSMPGYMAFGDGDGNVYAIMWMSPGVGLVWCSVGNGTSYTAGNNPDVPGGSLGVINLKTTKLTDAYGTSVAAGFNPGTMVGVAY